MENKLPHSADDKPPPYSVATAPPVNTSWQPPPGYYRNTGGAPFANNVPFYGATGTTGDTRSTTIIVPDTILVGGCPACTVGVMEDDYTCLGLLCAILFFPIGIICCLLLKVRRCSNCGVYFG